MFYLLITLPSDMKLTLGLIFLLITYRLLKKYEAPDHRNLALLAKLSHMYDTLEFPATKPPALHSLRPYKVPWNMFALHACHSAVPNSQILNVLNGSVVAMCHVSENDILVSLGSVHAEHLQLHSHLRPNGSY